MRVERRTILAATLALAAAMLVPAFILLSIGMEP